MDYLKRNRSVIVGILLSIYVFLLYSKKIVFITADLGRHLQNGKVFLEQGTILHTNFYSYTQPDFAVVTHHWGSGVVMYLVHLVAGFSGISLWHAGMAGATSMVWFWIAQRLSNIRIATLSFLIAITLVTRRVEIRPEIFSYLFFGLYLLLLIKFKENKLSFRWLMGWLLAIQIIWVNTHVLFVFGFLVVGVFLVDAIVRRNNKLAKQLSLGLIGVIGISIINPFGVKGLIEPFTILREYGYMIVENQSVPFIQNRFGGFIYGYYEMILGLLVVAWILYGVRRCKGKYSIPLLLLTFAMGVFSWQYIRVIPLFGYVFILASSYTFFKLYKSFKIPNEYLNYTIGVVILLIMWVGLGFGTSYSPWHQGRFGWGLHSNVNNSAEFFKDNTIQGPIFNNYDIGGYLVYHFYPEQKVFVDNRPEAYSVSFFKDTYIPAQENEDKWMALDNEYHFNAIYFYRHDATPWAQPFLIERIKDPAWIPVYVDNWTVILLKDSPTNYEVIDTYALPNEYFSIPSTL